MLKPMAYLTCDKILIAKDETFSLISLFTRIILSVPTGTDIPTDAVSQKEWAVFTMWETELGDEKLDYFICTQIIYPDRAPFMQINKQKLNILAGQRAQAAMQFIGFPIGRVGPRIVQIWIEHNDKKVVDTIELKIDLEVRHVDTPQKT